MVTIVTLVLKMKVADIVILQFLVKTESENTSVSLDSVYQFCLCLPTSPRKSAFVNVCCVCLHVFPAACTSTPHKGGDGELSVSKGWLLDIVQLEEGWDTQLSEHVLHLRPRTILRREDAGPLIMCESRKYSSWWDDGTNSGHICVQKNHSLWNCFCYIWEQTDLIKFYRIFQVPFGLGNKMLWDWS